MAREPRDRSRSVSAPSEKPVSACFCAWPVTTESSQTAATPNALNFWSNATLVPPLQLVADPSPGKPIRNRITPVAGYEFIFPAIDRVGTVVARRESHGA